MDQLGNTQYPCSTQGSRVVGAVCVIWVIEFTEIESGCLMTYWFIHQRSIGLYEHGSKSKTPLSTDSFIYSEVAM